MQGENSQVEVYENGILMFDVDDDECMAVEKPRE